MINDSSEVVNVNTLRHRRARGAAAVAIRALGYALLAAGQMVGWIALLFAVWSWRAGGNSYQTGRVGTIGDRLFPAFVALAAAGTAVAAAGFARREGRAARSAVMAAVAAALAVALANHLTGWRLLALPVHPLRNLLGEATFGAVALLEVGAGLLLLRAGGRWTPS